MSVGDTMQPTRKIEVNGEPLWMAISHDGNLLAHACAETVFVTDLQSGAAILQFDLKHSSDYCDWSPDGQYLAIVGDDVAEIHHWRTGRVKVLKNNSDPLFARWDATSSRLALNLDHSLVVIDVTTEATLTRAYFDHDVFDAAWLDNTSLVVAHWNGATVLDLPTGVQTRLLSLVQHAECLDFSQDGLIAVAHGLEVTIFDSSGATTHLQNAGAQVEALSFSFDGKLLAVRDEDGGIALWRNNEAWELVQSRETEKIATAYQVLQFSPTADILACLTNDSIEIYDFHTAPGIDVSRPTIYYTTVKIALVGDSGVGKTGLGWVLTHDGFKNHPSTHGEQFWLADRLSTTLPNGTECNAIVWDLAGQPDYRLIHSLFLDDADIALIVFDPTNRQDPLKGVKFWLRALSAAQGQRCHTILVGARIDRGTGVLSEAELDTFVENEGFAGGYIATSALLGTGVNELVERITRLIEWEKRPATVTIDTFRDIKNYVLQVKSEGSSQVPVLLTLEQLQRTLRETANRVYDLSDVARAAAHLSHHGYVRQLRDSKGELYVLLAPDLLNNIAASMILEARRNSKDLGTLDERRVLSSDYRLPELAELRPADREILLDAATALFLEHNICFRETLGDHTFLVFPSLINQNKPQVDVVKVAEGATYTVRGATENVYAALVVLLGYTNTFTRTNQWRNQAQYEMGKGQVCGFRLAEEREGEIDLVLYFGDDAEPVTRQLFQGLFEKFLFARDVSVEIFLPVECAKCRYVQPRSEVIKRRREDARAIFCSNCGSKVQLGSAPATQTRKSGSKTLSHEQRTAATRTRFEGAITALKSYLRDSTAAKAPSCFISYAWGDENHERWVERNLATDLRNAGVDVILDRWHCPPGTVLSRFVEQIESTDFALMVGTLRLLAKYQSKESDPVLTAELRLINSRLMKRDSESEHVLPLLLDGDQTRSFPPLARDSVYVDFRKTDDYFERLFDLLLRLYEIPFDHPAMTAPRDTIRSAGKRRR